MPLTNTLKNKLAADLKRELAIVRGMVYNNYQEWLRTVYEKGDKLNVAGEARKAMALNEGDLAFIDQEAIKIMTRPVPGELFEIHAQNVVNDISSIDPNKRSVAQNNLRQELMEALNLEPDLPF